MAVEVAAVAEETWVSGDTVACAAAEDGELLMGAVAEVGSVALGDRATAPDPETFSETRYGSALWKASDEVVLL